MKAFNLRLPKDLHKAIREMAYKLEASMNSLIVDAVRKEVEAKKKEKEAKK